MWIKLLVKHVAGEAARALEDAGGRWQEPAKIENHAVNNDRTVRNTTTTTGCRRRTLS